MPVDSDGKWESWDTRRAREAAAKAAAEESETLGDVARDGSPIETIAQPRRQRRSRKAAEAAIAEATGVTVDLSGENVAGDDDDSGDDTAESEDE